MGFWRRWRGDAGGRTGTGAEAVAGAEAGAHGRKGAVGDAIAFDERATAGGERSSARPVAAGRIAAVVALIAALAALSQAPRLLRHVSAFRVDRVEVVGTRYLAPHQALEASGITRASSVFDDPDPWREALLAHPMVAAVEVERRLPSTILLRVAEVEPVALVRVPELLAVDAAARVLPIEPTDGGLDLPVIGASATVEDGRVADTLAVALVDAAVRLKRLAPEIAERVSELAPGPGGAVRLWLRDPAGVEILLAPSLEAPRLVQLRATMAELRSRAELKSVRRIDVRFRDQVVVSL